MKNLGYLFSMVYLSFMVCLVMLIIDVMDKLSGLFQVM